VIVFCLHLPFAGTGIRIPVEHRRSDAGRIDMQTRKPSDVDWIVAQIDETRVAEHWRNPDRPDARFVKNVRRQDPKIRRAQTRLRTAHYRNRLDQAKRPSTYQIGMAMVAALATAELKSMSRSDWNLVGRALADLQSRGFDLLEVKSSLRQLRNRMVDPADREDEQTESTGDNSSLMF
jgi:hypothetical protein